MDNVCHYKEYDKEVVNYFRSISAHKSIGEGRFLSELFYRGRTQIHHEFLKNHFKSVYRKKYLSDLARKKLIYISNYDYGNGQCRYYNLMDEVQARAFVHFFTRQISLRHRNFHPPELQRPESPFVDEVMRYLTYNQHIYLSKFTELNIISDIENNRRSLTRVCNDCYNIINIHARLMNDEPETEIYTATRYMKAGYTGRLYEIAGGVQGLTRESKKVNWSGPDIYNYDIRSCVLAALSIFCDKLGINHKAIDNYVNNPDSKYEYATSIGVSVDCWKQSLISLIFGAKINRSGAPTVAIRNDVGRDNFDRVYNKFLEISEPIRFVISEWLSKVQHYSISMANSKGIIYNPVLCPLGLESSEFKKPGKLSAFFLQGLECKFIYNLILASKESTFQVLSCEFDGLITKGKIPQEVIEQARIDSGFNNVTLEIKDF